MTGIAKAKYVRLMSGVTKEQKPYYNGKFLDDEQENFVSFFMDEILFNKINQMNLSKGDEVILTLSISIGFKKTYISLIDIQKA